jgi:hypothetical protein
VKLVEYLGTRKINMKDKFIEFETNNENKNIEICTEA